jgi:hypothetical protein
MSPTKKNKKNTIAKSDPKKPSRPQLTRPRLKSRDAVPTSANRETYRVVLRTRQKTYVIPGERLRPISMQWYYRVRYRNRWSTSPEARQSLAQTALSSLQALNVTEAALDEIKDAGIVEVSIPFKDEEHGWDARILPWESLLRTATAKPDLTVIRHLDVKRTETTKKRTSHREGEIYEHRQQWPQTVCQSPA